MNHTEPHSPIPKLLSSPQVRWALRTVAIVFFLCVAWLAIDVARSLGMGDFQIYFNAMQSFLQGKSVYGVGHAATTLGQEWEGHTAFLYPPFAILLLIPLSHFSLESAAMIFSVISLLALTCAVSGLAHLVRALRVVSFPYELCAYAIGIGCALFFPIWLGFALGQVHTIILALLVWHAAAHVMGKSTLSGALLAFAIWIKISPGLLVLPLIALREWKTLRSFAFFFLAIGLAQLALIPDPNLWRDFYESYFGEASFAAAGDQIRQLSLFRILRDGFGFSFLWQCIIAAVIIAGSYTLISKLPKRSERSFVTGVSIFTCLMLLVSPITWSHHLTWALLPLVILLCSVMASASPFRWTAIITAGISISLSDFIIEFGRRITGLHSEPGLWSAYAVNAALITVILMCYEIAACGKLEKYYSHSSANL